MRILAFLVALSCFASGISQYGDEDPTRCYECGCNKDKKPKI